MDDRTPPAAVEVESTVLASMMLDAGACDRAMELLVDDDFYSLNNRLVFASIRSLISAGQPVDITTVSHELRKNENFSEIPEVFVGEMLENLASVSNPEPYCKILESKTSLRSLISASMEIQGMAFQKNVDAENLLNHAEASVMRIVEKRTKVSFETPKTILPRTMDMIEHRSKHGISGISTGFPKLDTKTGGLINGDLTILAGRPSMGKTSLAFGIAMNAAIVLKKPVAIFELEMTKEQLVEKAISHETEIDSKALRTGTLTRSQLAEIGMKTDSIWTAPLYIDDNPYLNISKCRSICRRLKKRHGIELFIIDYLQLMQGVGNERSKNEEVGEISKGLKGIAKELNVPVIALSQLSRAVEKRNGDHRPNLSDLRDSGSIEQDADCVMFVYREEHYFPKEENRGQAEIIIGKQRNGPIGTVKVSFKAHCTKFYEDSEPDDPGFEPPDEHKERYYQKY